MDVRGKSAIVTGAGSGINYCFAKLLLESGCNVLVADVALRPEAEDLISQYSTKSGAARAVFQKTDVTDWAQLDNMFVKAVEEFGSIDVVCPGAGVFEPDWSAFWHPPGTPPSRDDPTASRYKQLDINLTHPIRVTQLSISHFLAHKQPGTIVLISSIAGQLPVFPVACYSTTKHALNGFVRSLAALESPPEDSGIPRIRVVAVAPGIVRTPIWLDDPNKLKMVLEGVDDWVLPETVAKVMLELVTGPENVGGTILEVAAGVRSVQPFMDPGPSGKGVSVSGIGENVNDVWALLQSRVGKT